MAPDNRVTESMDDGYWNALLQDVELSDGSAGQRRPPAPQPAEGWTGEPAGAAAQETAWQWAQEIFDRDEAIEGVVVGFNRGGLLVTVGELAGFVPASHMVGLARWQNEQDRTEQLGRKIGESLRLKVLELNRAQNRFILSERLAMGRQRDGEALLQSLKVGDICTGKVNHITDFGAFVDLGGIDGLIHVSELAWERVGHPRDLLRTGQDVQVCVISIDAQKRRIQLSIKRLQPDPWASAAQRYQVGQVIEGVITNVTDFGAFAKVDEGLEGLIHVSELAEGNFLHPRNVVQKGDRVQARILAIDSQRHRLALTLRLVPKAF